MANVARAFAIPPDLVTEAAERGGRELPSHIFELDDGSFVVRDDFFDSIDEVAVALLIETDLADFAWLEDVLEDDLDHPDIGEEW